MKKTATPTDFGGFRGRGAGGGGTRVGMILFHGADGKDLSCFGRVPRPHVT